ncbi:MAG: aminotransferase class III-fold pyridoxal phosphate-dependent enzyme [Acidimicrobiales bacterium]
MALTEDLRARRDRALGAGAPLFYHEPIELVRGEGVHLFAPDGRRYLDLYNNVPCVGHANARVVEAMTRQQATLNVHSRYLHDGIVELAERLVGLHPAGPDPGGTGPPIESVVFSCSGTEAVEVALTMARVATGRRGIVATDATYHGNSEAVHALTRAATEPAAHPEIRTIPFPRLFRPIEPGADPSALAAAHLQRLEQAIASLRQSGPGLAAVIFCSILANEGLPDIPPGFMPAAAAMVREAGGLVIADEVQAGYGRTGRWWGYQVSGFEPDIVVTGKPMGNGLPLSATAARRELVERFRSEHRHFNTFAASPLQAAVGLAVIDEIEQRDLLSQVASVGTGLKRSLTERMAGRPWMGDVRGHGLFLGIEAVQPGADQAPDRDRAVDVANRLKDKGCLVSNAGAHGNVVKIRPPLVFGHDDAREFLAAFDEVLAETDDS